MAYKVKLEHGVRTNVGLQICKQALLREDFFKTRQKILVKKLSLHIRTKVLAFQNISLVGLSL